MSARWLRNLLLLTYFVIGGYIAWDHGYISVGWLRSFASAALAIIFWWLIPLGVNLHIHS